MTVSALPAARPRRSRFRLISPETGPSAARGRLAEVEIFGFDETGGVEHDQHDQVLRIRGDRTARQAIARDASWGRLSAGDTDTLYFLDEVDTATKDLAVVLTELVTVPVAGRIDLLLALDWETQPRGPGGPPEPTEIGQHVRTLRTAGPSPADQAASFEALSEALCAAVAQVPMLGWADSVVTLPADGARAAHGTSRLAGRVATNLGKRAVQPVVWQRDQVAFADRLGRSCLVVADRIAAGTDLRAFADAIRTGDIQHVYVLACWSRR